LHNRVQTVAVHYLEEARPSVNRAEKERVGLELSFDANVLSGATCEAEYWAQSRASDNGHGPLVRLQVELLPQSWEVTASQKRTAFGLAVEVSAMIGGIHLVFFGLLLVVERFKKRAKKIHISCIRRFCRKTDAHVAGDDGDSESDDDIEEGGDAAPLLPPTKKIDNATDRIARLERNVRMLTLGQRTLYAGGKAKAPKLDLVEQLWSTPEVLVEGCTDADSPAVQRLAGSFTRSHSSVGGAYPTWIQEGVDGAAPLALFFSHRRWKIGVLGRSASVRSAEKSRNLENSTSPLELTWEVRVGRAWLRHETLAVAAPASKIKRTLAKIFKKKKTSSLRAAAGVAREQGKNNPMHREEREGGSDDEDSASSSSNDDDSSGNDSGADAHPRGWVAHDAPDGRTYFVNVHTKATQWDQPTLPAPPEGWRVALGTADDGSQAPYYAHAETQQVQWHHPNDARDI